MISSVQPLPRAPRVRRSRTLACGAWLKNTVCLLDGDTVYWSALHGDLSEPGSCMALEASVEALLQTVPDGVDAVAHDLHPDFHSTRVAIEVARRLDVPVHGVQHHHAHIAAVQAEYGLDEPVIGLALDGVGLGTDGLAWGGELLWVDGAKWQRLGHFSPLMLPGGDMAAREPWRMTSAVLQSLGRGDEIPARFGPLAGVTAAITVQTMLERRLNCPVTTSAGRWFDAAAGALGLWQRQAFEAQAAIKLEQSAQAWLSEHSLQPDLNDIPITADNQLDLRPLLARLIDRVCMSLKGKPQALAEDLGTCAARFHLTLADGLAHWAEQAARRLGLDTLALGGGCFMNRVLTRRLIETCGRMNLRVLLPVANPCGDSGLALGQAWVAAGSLQHGPRMVIPDPLHQLEPQPCV